MISKSLVKMWEFIKTGVRPVVPASPRFSKNDFKICKEQNKNLFQNFGEKIKMTILRAKNNKNKLEVFDNRPFIVEQVEILTNGGLSLAVGDLENGYITTVVYAETADILKEWDISNKIGNVKRVEYEEINGYAD